MSKTDWLRLKAALLVEGLDTEPEALEGVGTEFKEQHHGLFAWDFENYVAWVLHDALREKGIQ